MADTETAPLVEGGEAAGEAGGFCIKGVCGCAAACCVALIIALIVIFLLFGSILQAVAGGGTDLDNITRTTAVATSSPPSTTLLSTTDGLGHRSTSDAPPPSTVPPVVMTTPPASDGGPYFLWHLNHDTADKVKSKTGVSYSLIYGEDKHTSEYADWTAASKAAHGGAWMLTYKSEEDGEEYLCRTEPNAKSTIHNGATYEGYWLPVFQKLSEVHHFASGPAAAAACHPQSFALRHVGHGGEVTSKTGVGYALKHVVSKASSWADADQLTAGGAWLLTRSVRDGGGRIQEYLCKTEPNAKSKIHNGDTYEGYWQPILHSLSQKHGIITGEGNAAVCEA